MLKIFVQLKKIPYLSDCLRNLRIFVWSIRSPKLTKWGFKFYGNPYMVNNEFEIQESIFFQKIINNFDVLINIGANIGYYSCMGCVHKKQLVAFEPDSTNFKILKKNLYINKFEDVELHHCALSDKNGLGIIYGSGTGASLINGWNFQRSEHIVAIQQFDTLIGGRFNDKNALVWMDVEGAELIVLKGMLKFIEIAHAVFVIEICLGVHAPNPLQANINAIEVLTMFNDHGYKIFNLSNECIEISFSSIISDITAENYKNFSQTFYFSRTPISINHNV